MYPTQTQETTLFQWLDQLCELQNSARHDRMVAWETEGERVFCNDQQRKLTVARKKYTDFREVPQDMQVCALERTDKAFDGFYRRCKNGATKKGYPRHRKRIRSMSWKLRKSKGVRQNPIRKTTWKHDRLKVPKLSEVKIYMHRPIQGDPKEVTLVKKASGWYAHISCELPDIPKVEPTDAIAVDVGTTHYLTTSEGEKVDNPRWYREAEGLLRKHSRDFSRKKKGSQRWRKQSHKLSLHHERTANKRKDFIAKLVYKLYHHDQNNVFHFHQVDPKNTSQTCSCCGEKSPKKLSLAVRTFNCVFCGRALDRDHNAAINILLKAAAAFRGERWVTTLDEARNTNEARDTGLQEAIQLLLFSTSPSL